MNIPKLPKYIIRKIASYIDWETFTSHSRLAVFFSLLMNYNKKQGEISHHVMDEFLDKHVSSSISIKSSDIDEIYKKLINIKARIDETAHIVATDFHKYAHDVKSFISHHPNCDYLAVAICNMATPKYPPTRDYVTIIFDYRETPSIFEECTLPDDWNTRDCHGNRCLKDDPNEFDPDADYDMDSTKWCTCCHGYPTVGNCVAYGYEVSNIPRKSILFIVKSKYEPHVDYDFKY